MEELAKHRTKPLYKILNDILNDLLTIHDTKNESIEEIKRYMKEFPSLPDYGIADHGNVKFYILEIRQMYRESGVGCSLEAMTDAKLWQNYKKKVGQVAKYIVENQYKFQKFTCDECYEFNEETNECSHISCMNEEFYEIDKPNN